MSYTIFMTRFRFFSFSTIIISFLLLILWSLGFTLSISFSLLNLCSILRFTLFIIYFFIIYWSLGFTLSLHKHGRFTFLIFLIIILFMTDFVSVVNAIRIC